MHHSSQSKRNQLWTHKNNKSTWILSKGITTTKSTEGITWRENTEPQKKRIDTKAKIIGNSKQLEIELPEIKVVKRATVKVKILVEVRAEISIGHLRQIVEVVEIEQVEMQKRKLAPVLRVFLNTIKGVVTGIETVIEIESQREAPGADIIVEMTRKEAVVPIPNMGVAIIKRKKTQRGNIWVGIMTQIITNSIVKNMRCIINGIIIWNRMYGRPICKLSQVIWFLIQLDNIDGNLKFTSHPMIIDLRIFKIKKFIFCPSQKLKMVHLTRFRTWKMILTILKYTSTQELT